ncbi:MAG TPA: TspO/MBR family protein [Terriglobales bacterium]|jgi:tryptophan-rich sensory protein
MRRSRSFLAFAGFAAGTIAAAWVGSRYNPKGGTKIWYNALRKPAYNPPRAVFPIVWPILYTLMAWSAYRVWRREPSAERTRALVLWTAQLGTNAAWSKLFFGQRRPDLALVDLDVMRALIAAYMKSAYQVDRMAAAVFLPYFAWVTFARKLNKEIVRRNLPEGRLLAA